MSIFKLAVLAPSFALALLAAPAVASPSYPGELLDALNMDCAAPCTVCHQDQTGGSGTATKRFAEAMIDVGLEGGDEGTVKSAAQALEANGTDSDGDGVGDIDELKQGRDPNVEGDASICGPQYGCGARVSSQPARGSEPWIVAASAVALALGLGRRRRRR
ncbi:MAG: hypothetical protein R3B13_10490 [Polyangiaceae bacterium]